MCDVIARLRKFPAHSSVARFDPARLCDVLFTKKREFLELVFSAYVIKSSRLLEHVKLVRCLFLIKLSSHTYALTTSQWNDYRKRSYVQGINTDVFVCECDASWIKSMNYNFIFSLRTRVPATYISSRRLILF